MGTITIDGLGPSSQPLSGNEVVALVKDNSTLNAPVSAISNLYELPSDIEVEYVQLADTSNVTLPNGSLGLNENSLTLHDGATNGGNPIVGLSYLETPPFYGVVDNADINAGDQQLLIGSFAIPGIDIQSGKKWGWYGDLTVFQTGTGAAYTASIRMIARSVGNIAKYVGFTCVDNNAGTELGALHALHGEVKLLDGTGGDAGKFALQDGDQVTDGLASKIGGSPLDQSFTLNSATSTLGGSPYFDPVDTYFDVYLFITTSPASAGDVVVMSRNLSLRPLS